ncbi:unnamed protein product, partial [Amoebophrya sp. A120]
ASNHTAAPNTSYSFSAPRPVEQATIACSPALSSGAASSPYLMSSRTSVLAATPELHPMSWSEDVFYTPGADHDTVDVHGD